MKAGYHVGEWLKAPRVEGPITPDDAGDLAKALLWDEQYERAHDLAGDLTKFYSKSSPADDWHRDMWFGEWLGIRSALSAVIANKNQKRHKRAMRARARTSKPAERPLSTSRGGL